MDNTQTWEIPRPVDCQSCIGEGNHANTPRIIFQLGNYKGIPRGSIVCRWCGIEITAPSLIEAVDKWHRIQELIRLGYSVIQSKEEWDQ